MKRRATIFWSALLLTLSLSWAEKGEQAYSRGDFPEAISRYTEARRSDSLDARHRYNLGTALLGGGLHSDAVAELQNALPLADSALTPAIHYNIGNALYRAGNSAQPQEKVESWRGAIEAWKQTLLYNPKHENAKRNIELVQKRLQQELDRQKEQEKNQEENEKEKEKNEENNQDQQSSEEQNQSQEQQGSSAGSGDDQSSDSSGGSSEKGSSSGDQEKQGEQDLSSEGGKSSEGSADQNPPPPSSSSGELTPEEARQLLESFADQDHREKGKPSRAEARAMEKDW